MMPEQTFECPSCGQRRDEEQRRPGDLIPGAVAGAIKVFAAPSWLPPSRADFDSR